MAFVLLDTDITKGNVARVLNGTLTVAMPDTVTIVSTNNDGLRFNSGTATMMLGGDIYADRDALEILGRATVTLGDSATLFGGGFGIRATKELELTNHGAVTGGTLGLKATAALTFDNYGTINGVLAESGAVITNGLEGRITGALTVEAGAGDVVDIVNDGTIGRGGVDVTAAVKASFSNSGIVRGDVSFDLPGNRKVEVDNSGLIGGDLKLGRGNDLVDLRGGIVTGDVIGGRGNDTYIVDDPTISIIEAAANGGTDTIMASVDFGLDIAPNVETLVLTGGESLRGIGSARADEIIGNSGGNRISGLDGKDTLIGGSGGDSLRGGRGGDRLEGDSEEDLIVGGAGSDTLFGGSGDDTLLGGGLHDRIYGGDGNDAINAGFGNDTIIAGRGLDDMTGSFGNDTFRFEDITIWHATATDDDVARPIVSDFKQGADAIDLRAIDANGTGPDTAFTFIGTNVAFSGVSGELRADTTLSAGRTVLQGDIDGDGVADLDIELLGTMTLAGTDIFL